MDNQYSREYQAYLTYALQRYLTEHCDYNEKDAESGWSELLAWFRKHEILE